MDKELLEQYTFIKIEIADLEKRLESTSHSTVDISKLQQSLKALEGIRHQIEIEIYSVDDSFMRSLLRFRYIDGMTWADAAKKFGEGYTPDMLRKAHQRFIKRTE